MSFCYVNLLEYLVILLVLLQSKSKKIGIFYVLRPPHGLHFLQGFCRGCQSKSHDVNNGFFCKQTIYWTFFACVPDIFSVKNLMWTFFK